MTSPIARRTAAQRSSSGSDASAVRSTECTSLVNSAGVVAFAGADAAEWVARRLDQARAAQARRGGRR